MIWLVTAMNGQQRPLAIPTILVLAGEATTASAATTPFPSGHFYTCRTEC